ncbi:MAG: MBL fold metallo-hydrolase [Marinifilaceae bacterium]
MLNLIPLGSSGWIPTDTRSTSSFLCHTPNILILLDAGTGLHKLRNYTSLLDQYDEIHLILSHYHLDHIIGLSYLPRFVANKTLHLYGPGKPYYPEGCKELLCRFTSPPYFARTIDTFAREVYFHDYNVAGFQIGKLEIGIEVQQHSHPSFGITLGHYLHYATDTNANHSTFQKKVQLLLHECWELKKENAEEHSSLEEILNMAKHSDIPRIGLIHLNPFYSENQLTEFQTQNVFNVEEGKVILLNE